MILFRTLSIKRLFLLNLTIIFNILNLKSSVKIFRHDICVFFLFLKLSPIFLSLSTFLIRFKILVYPTIKVIFKKKEKNIIAETAWHIITKSSSRAKIWEKKSWRWRRKRIWMGGEVGRFVCSITVVEEPGDWFQGMKWSGVGHRSGS